MKPSEAYDLLVERGFIQSGKVGTSVESLARVTAQAVAMGIKRGASLDDMCKTMARIDDHGI